MSRPRALWFVCVLSLLWGVAVAASTQTPPVPTFEVASVKENKSADTRSSFTVLPNGRVSLTNVTLRDAIVTAYGINPLLARFTVVPELDTTGPRFDITAVPPDNPGAGREQSLLMLRTLLAERFGLRVHTETRQIPVYALTVAREDGKLGPQLRASSHDCAAFQVGRSEGRLTLADEPVDAGGVGLCISRNPPPPGVAAIQWAGPLLWLPRQVGGYLDRPLVDATGLTGNYEWRLTFNRTPDRRPDVDAPSIYTAVPEQLGLRLDRRTAPYEVLVVDAMNKMPTPN